MIERRAFGSLGNSGPWGVNARHHFSFADYYDPKRVNWGVLRAWNDDEIAPYTGFAPHSHANMEIITYVRQGAISYRDTNGNRGRTEAGEVHVLSTGSGIRHTEYNREPEATKIFQIWIASRQAGGDPAWGAKPFPKAGRSGDLVMLASGVTDDDEALPLRADARVLGATLRAGDSVKYKIGENRYGYLVPAAGAVTVNDLCIETGDGAAIAQTGVVTIRALDHSEIILVDAG